MPARKASHASPWKGGQQLTAAEGGWSAVAPSSIPFTEKELAPVALDEEGIRKVISDFRTGTARAKEAGYEVLEIHAAHGYLLHQFLSPLSNKRQDGYGGSFENRVRLLLEVVDAVNTEWEKNYPLFVRISGSDWAEGGWDADASVKLAALLKEKGVDLIDCSSGGLVPKAAIPVGPGYQVPFAERIKKETGMLTGAVGLITSPVQAEEILANQQADLIFLARQLLRDPYFALHAAHALDTSIEWPVQYERAKPR